MTMDTPIYGNIIAIIPINHHRASSHWGTPMTMETSQYGLTADIPLITKPPRCIPTNDQYIYIYICIYIYIYIWLVVWNIFYFCIYWVSNHSNWLSYFSEGLKPPTSIYIYINHSNIYRMTVRTADRRRLHLRRALGAVDRPPGRTPGPARAADVGHGSGAGGVGGVGVGGLGEKAEKL